ncbi:hypothetical protein HMPREF0322_05331 [Desulfitobacterium hafniense DP7]|uniref:Uncharacterized protein n=1 Tax=Desulfitobacterium hafniense DP7 TaxID=537010 RepID=G9XWG4_DESHA|nr:hypothetical protein HMPREF0322_05331 [Desulfitobacterium hafniense DP7]
MFIKEITSSQDSFKQVSSGLAFHFPYLSLTFWEKNGIIKN